MYVDLESKYCVDHVVHFTCRKEGVWAPALKSSKLLLCLLQTAIETFRTLAYLVLGKKNGLGTLLVSITGKLNI